MGILENYIGKKVSVKVIETIGKEEEKVENIKIYFGILKRVDDEFIELEYLKNFDEKKKFKIINKNSIKEIKEYEVRDEKRKFRRNNKVNRSFKEY